MKLHTFCLGVIAAALLGGCATTVAPDETAAAIATAEANAPRNCGSTSLSRMTSRMRQRCAGVRTMDKSFMEQQITPCAGGVCGRSGGG